MTSDLLEENADLRKQVAELKEQLEKHKWNNIFLEDCAVYDKEIAEEYKTLQERIAELEKENAELKKQIEKMKCCGNCKYYQFQDDAEYYTCTKDGECNGRYYRSCEFSLEKWDGR